jgi:hypothetical protein
MLFAQDGMPVKSMLVPLVDATAVPDTIFAVEDHEVPFVVNRTLPVVVGETAVTALVPLPIRAPPEVRDVAPVPPCATVTAVPDWRTVPLTFGRVSVVLLAAAPASRVTPPPPEPLTLTGIRQCSTLSRREP